MDNKPLLYGVIGLLVGVGITTYAASSAVNTGNTNMMRMMGMRSGTGLQQQESMMGDAGMQKSMDEMMGSVTDKTGEAFDRAFLASMIVHHQGAIEMANLAQSYAVHDELKTLAGDIIDAQTREITQMRAWQKAWGY
jgi:uncharacterized protein (DUF305 family)